ncbi:MAG: hypothetical protein SWH78_12040 [Thermodesulfobacteriota bacterium]|nr:hypothetical protein [Thermodesulfobacteriota bacterium]
MLTKMAVGIPERNKAALKRFDLNVKKAKIRAKAEREAIDRKPLQAWTTCIVKPGR